MSGFPFQDAATRLQLRLVAFEKNAIRRILQLSCSRHEIPLQRLSPLPETFAVFHETYGSFPVALLPSMADNASGEHLGWTRLFGKSFAKLPQFAAFDSHSDQTDAAAVLFPMVGVAGGGIMVISRGVEPSANCQDTTVRQRIGDHVYVLQCLPDFLLAVDEGCDWLPRY